MATLYITEYERLANADYGGGIQAPLEPPIAEQTVTIGASSAQSAKFNSATRLVRLHTDTACHIKVAADPKAKTTNRRMIADSTEFIGLPSSQELKIGVIQS